MDQLVFLLMYISRLILAKFGIVLMGGAAVMNRRICYIIAFFACANLGCTPAPAEADTFAYDGRTYAFEELPHPSLAEEKLGAISVRDEESGQLLYYKTTIYRPSVDKKCPVISKLSRNNNSISYVQLCGWSGQYLKVFLFDIAGESPLLASFEFYKIQPNLKYMPQDGSIAALDMEDVTFVVSEGKNVILEGNTESPIVYRMNLVSEPNTAQHFSRVGISRYADERYREYYNGFDVNNAEISNNTNIIGHNINIVAVLSKYSDLRESCENLRSLANSVNNLKILDYKYEFRSALNNGSLTSIYCSSS